MGKDFSFLFVLNLDIGPVEIKLGITVCYTRQYALRRGTKELDMLFIVLPEQRYLMIF